MKLFALTTALTLAIAAPAFASDQLARNLGVDAGAYTTSQLVELKDAVEQNDNVRISQLMRQSAAGGSFTVSSKSAPSAGHVALASTLGVNSSDYSFAQLVELKDAVDQNDNVRISQLMRQSAEGGNFTVSTKSMPSVGHVKIAQSVGVDPYAYSLAEVIELRDEIAQNNWSRVRQITNR